jgi:hypothetical protein
MPNKNQDIFEKNRVKMTAENEKFSVAMTLFQRWSSTLPIAPGNLI